MLESTTKGNDSDIKSPKIFNIDQNLEKSISHKSSDGEILINEDTNKNVNIFANKSKKIDLKKHKEIISETNDNPITSKAQKNSMKSFKSIKKESFITDSRIDNDYFYQKTDSNKNSSKIIGKSLHFKTSDKKLNNKIKNDSNKRESLESSKDGICNKHNSISCKKKTKRQSYLNILEI